MEGGSLFNPGFLGASFNWWIGQIASDSTWRDNILPGKFESKDEVQGWGRRYKVRIIGLHDQGETEISSDQLPWAQVMYPVTGGGGQANSGATANLRQGMMVFGFFLDGQEQQVPVIMGVLGNNVQTQLATKIGDNKVTNTQPGSLATSGHAEPADGNKDPFISVPHNGLEVVRPGVQPECAPAPPGAKLDKYGLVEGVQRTPEQQRDISSAIARANDLGLNAAATDLFVSNSVQNGIKSRCESANSSSTPPKAGATVENVDAVHKLTAADVIRHEYYNKKTVLMSPCDKVQSALKAIQTELDNLTKDIDKILNAANSYIDAVTNLLGSIQSLISDIACKIAKYMKIVFDKIMEYVLKQINKGLSPTVEQVPPNMRHRFFDIKKSVAELITCLYSKITNNLCGLIEGLLNEKIEKELPNDNNKKSPSTPMCSVEELAGNILSLNMDEMTNTVNGLLDNVNKFLNDIQSDIGTIGGFKDLIGGISGSITSALSFENISLNIFGCELKPNCPSSDYYTLNSGSGGSIDAQIPRVAQVDKVSQQSVTKPRSTQTPFAQPSQNQLDVKIQNGASKINQTAEFIRSI